MHSCLLNEICFKNNICREHCGLSSILVHVCISGVSSKPLSTQVDFLVIQELFMRIYLTSVFLLMSFWMHPLIWHHLTSTDSFISFYLCSVQFFKL